MDQQKIGRFLKELRNQKGMTQEQLGAQLLVTNKTISRWETGDYMVPVEQLIVLSQLYDVNINELLQGERIQANELDQRSADNIVHALETVAQQQGINNHNIKVKHSLFAFNILLLCSLWVVSMFERQLSNYGLYPIVGYSIHELFSLIPFLCIGVTVCYLIVFSTKKSKQRLRKISIVCLVGLLFFQIATLYIDASRVTIMSVARIINIDFDQEEVTIENDMGTLTLQCPSILTALLDEGMEYGITYLSQKGNRGSITMIQKIRD